MKQFSLIGIAMAALCFSAVAKSGTLYVERWGQAYTDCSRTDPCNEISDAVSQATPNSRIVVGPGKYQGGFVINQRGIKLESTGGPKVTFIESTAPNIIGIDIQADSVSIGKKGGKGFTISSNSAQVINVGIPDSVGSCSIDSFTTIEGEIFYFAQQSFLPGSSFSKTRIEGNNLEQILDVSGTVDLLGEFCFLDNFDNPTQAILEYSELMQALSINGESTIISGNNIIGTGSHVLHLTGPGRYTITDNNIKYDISKLDVLPEYPLDGSFQYAAIHTEGIRGQISNNSIERIGFVQSGFIFTYGIINFAYESNTRITSNVVDNFAYNIDVSSSTVSKNIVTNASERGITDFRDSTISDNTVFSSGLSGFGFGTAGIGASNSASIRGNNVSGNTYAAGITISQYADLFDTKAKALTVSGNNFYELNEENFTFFGQELGGRCAVFFSSVEVPVKMSKNFFGSSTEFPQIKESIYFDVVNVPSSVGSSWHNCAANGLVSNTTSGLEIANVTTKPTLKPNRIKAIIRTNKF